MKKQPPKIYTLHQHDLADFMQCPFRYGMANVGHFAPKQLSNAINIGALFSKGVERLHTTGKLEEARLLVQAEHDMKLIKANTNNFAEDININAGIVRAMLTGYHKNFITDYKSTMPIKQIIPEFKVYWEKLVCGVKFIYICTLDGKVVLEDNTLNILEIKTSAQVSRDLILELPTNFQINSYWAAMVHQLKEKPSGILYRFVVKPGIRLKKNETVDQYDTRVNEEYINNTERYFYEEQLLLDYNNLLKFQDDIDAAFYDLVRCYVTNKWPRRGTACRTKYGTFCKYIQYCSNPTQDTLDTYYKREEPTK